MAHRKHHDKADLQNEVAVRRVIGEREAEMNVTPLIDVLLVLLVIFIARLPLTQKGMDINLPLETSATVTKNDVTQVIVARASDKQVTINGEAVDLAALQERLRGIFEARTDKTVFVKGAGDLRYGEVMPLIDASKAIGLKIGLITPGMEAEAQRPK